jgi:uncharacterized membrane protein
MVTPPDGKMRFWRRPAPLGSVFILTGTSHFLVPDYYLRIIPPFLPHGRVLVYLSGAAEVLGGLGVLGRRWRPAAGLGLILLLVAVFPANVQMLLLAREARAPGWKEILLWLRLPLQVALITWVWFVTRHETQQLETRVRD